MGSASIKAKVIRVMVKEGNTGLLYGTSPDLKGLLLVEESLGSLYRAVPGAVVDLYAALGKHVVVYSLEESEPGYQSWVAVPTTD
jgi:hypothetical protein